MEPEQTISHTSKQLMILNKFRKRLEREKYVNNYASNYYGTLQSKFTIPGILITGICSVASFMATSDMLTDGTKAGFSVGVGILTAGATILQSVSSSFGFGARKDAFQKSADSYDDLITKIEFEIYNPNERFADFCNDLEEAILKIKNDCSFLPPLFVIAKYEEEIKKAHLKLDGSPSKDGSMFGDMMDRLNNYPTLSMPENTTIHPAVSNNRPDIINKVVGAITDNLSVKIDIPSILDDKVVKDAVNVVNSSVADLEYDETVTPVLLLDDVTPVMSTNNSQNSDA